MGEQFGHSYSCSQPVSRVLCPLCGQSVYLLIHYDCIEDSRVSIAKVRCWRATHVFSCVSHTWGLCACTCTEMEGISYPRLYITVNTQTWDRIWLLCAKPVWAWMVVHTRIIICNTTPIIIWTCVSQEWKKVQWQAYWLYYCNIDWLTRQKSRFRSKWVLFSNPITQF